MAIYGLANLPLEGWDSPVCCAAPLGCGHIRAFIANGASDAFVTGHMRIAPVESFYSVVVYHIGWRDFCIESTVSFKSY